ncbi:lipid asymmetry maintenance protein MlaB [Pseudomonadota bacterium]
MPIKRRDKGGKNSKTCRLAIEGDMTIYTAQELKDELIKYLGKPWNLHIDLTDITELDTSGAQLLLLARHETDHMEKAFEVTQPSGAAAEALATLNISERLNLQAPAA